MCEFCDFTTLQIYFYGVLVGVTTHVFMDLGAFFLHRIILRLEHSFNIQSKESQHNDQDHDQTKV